MFGSKRSSKDIEKSEAELTEMGRKFAFAWKDEINQTCNSHLLYVSTFVDEDWEEAERTGDLQTVITRYSGAVDGTEEWANNSFKQYEVRANELGLTELIQYTKIRKLQHLVQLRTYFEYKLKLNMVPAGPNRDKLRKHVLQMLSPELSEQF